MPAFAATPLALFLSNHAVQATLPLALTSAAVPELSWDSTWIGPVRHLVLPFIARQEQDEILLEGSFALGHQTRWIFSHITPTRFDWRNMESSDNGDTWTTVQEMVAQRASSSVT